MSRRYPSDFEMEQSGFKQVVRDIAAGSVAFFSRWTIGDLERENKELCKRFLAQNKRWLEARGTIEGGDFEEAKLQGLALIRGFTAITNAMEEAKQTDTTFMIGQAKNGLRVAIGTKVSQPRVLEVEGQRCIFLTPDEVANILEITESLKTVVAIKAQWPGAEIVGEHEGQTKLDRYPDEPAKED